MEKQFECKVCGYGWNTKKNIIRPKSCAKRGCRSILWDRGLDDCKFYINKKYQQQAIKGKYNSNGCLIAIGNPRSKNQKYHSIRRDGKSWLLHRWIFYNYYGYDTIGEVMHTCNNPDCINPLHLKSGTHQENEDYKIECGRTLVGEKNPMSKLKYPQVLLIKQELINLERGGLTRLAHKYNVSPAAIALIKSGKNWK